MSSDSIEPGRSVDAYELDDTEPSVATSEQSDRDAALAANEYPGGLADLGLVDPELDQVLDESDFDPAGPGPENAEQNPTGLGEPSSAATGRTNAEANPTGLGNPSPTAVGEPNARHNTTGLGNPNPDAVGSTNAEQNTTGLGDPNTQQAGRLEASDPSTSGNVAVMPPFPPGTLPRPPEPGPDVPQPQIPDESEPPRPDNRLPRHPVPGGGLGHPAPTPGLTGQPTIPLPGAPGLTGGPGITGTSPPVRR